MPRVDLINFNDAAINPTKILYAYPNGKGTKVHLQGNAEIDLTVSFDAAVKTLRRERHDLTLARDPDKLLFDRAEVSSLQANGDAATTLTFSDGSRRDLNQPYKAAKSYVEYGGMR